LTTAGERSLQALQVFKHAQPAQRKGRFARFGQGAADQLGIGAQHFRVRIFSGHLFLEGATGRIKWPANGFFQGLFEALVSVRNRPRRFPQAMNLAGLMRYAREGLGHGDDQRLLIVAHDPPQAIAQGFDGLEQTLRQGAVIGREQRHFVEH
jgi:hypothetical protein